MSKLRKLSAAYGDSPSGYAVCVSCGEAFIDDAAHRGSLLCPNHCGSNLVRCDGLAEINAVLRGYGKPEVTE